MKYTICSHFALAYVDIKLELMILMSLHSTRNRVRESVCMGTRRTCVLAGNICTNICKVVLTFSQSLYAAVLRFARTRVRPRPLTGLEPTANSHQHLDGCKGCEVASRFHTFVHTLRGQLMATMSRFIEKITVWRSHKSTSVPTGVRTYIDLYTLT
jgi:hypothetical protein